MAFFGQDDDQQMGPFTAPMMARLKALKIVTAIQAIKDQEEDRKVRRELVKLQLDRARRDTLREDFETSIALRNIGAMPAAAPDTGASDATIMSGTFGPGPEGYRPRVTAPTGQAYRLPSRNEMFDRQQLEARRAGVLEGTKAATKSAIVEQAGRASGALLPVKFPKIGDQAERTIYVDKDHYGAAVKTLREIQNGKIINGTYKTNKQTGETLFYGLDADSREPIKRSFGFDMPPELDDKAAEAEYLAGQDRSTERERRIGELMQPGGWADSQLPEPTVNLDPAAHNLRKRKLAEDAVDKAMGLEKKQGIARAKVGARSRGKGQYAGRRIKRANVAKAAQAAGKTAAEFERWFVGQGGAVIQ